MLMNACTDTTARRQSEKLDRMHEGLVPCPFFAAAQRAGVERCAHPQRTRPLLRASFESFQARARAGGRALAGDDAHGRRAATQTCRGARPDPQSLLGDWAQSGGPQNALPQATRRRGRDSDDVPVGGASSKGLPPGGAGAASTPAPRRPGALCTVCAAEIGALRPSELAPAGRGAGGRSAAIKWRPPCTCSPY